MDSMEITYSMRSIDSKDSITDSMDPMGSKDSTDSADSMDSIDSIYSMNSMDAMSSMESMASMASMAFIAFEASMASMTFTDCMEYIHFMIPWMTFLGMAKRPCNFSIYGKCFELLCERTLCLSSHSLLEHAFEVTWLL